MAKQDCSSIPQASSSAALEPLEARLLMDAGPQGAAAVELFSVSPAVFVENQGQWANESVQYAFHGDGANILFTDGGPVFELFQDHAEEGATADPADPADEPPWAAPDPMRPDDVVAEATRFSVQFDGANTVTPVGLDQAETVFNYHVGDQSTWRDGVPTYEAVAYLGLYDGIDLHTWGRRDSLKYEFHVSPGADHQAISVSYDGIEGLSIDAAGALHVQTELGDLVDDAPYIYQIIDGREVEVAGEFVLVDADTYAFDITGPHDAGVELIIDPDLAWSTWTLLGGSDEDYGTDIAVDALGNAYVTGYSGSFDWARGGFNPSRGSCIFVAKVTSGGGHAWSTYMGDPGAHGSILDEGCGIAVDRAGGVYVTGETNWSGWAHGGFDPSYNGNGDIFVAKLTSAGGHAWSTYMGGSGYDRGWDIAVDGAGGVYVTGETYSAGWAWGGFDPSHGGERDIFVAKLTSGGGHVWSTYMGGSDFDEGLGIAVDGSGGVYVTGRTRSSGWARGGFDTGNDGRGDIFVAKLTSAGGHVWSTYMGGSRDDSGHGIAVDGSGGVYVTGYTFSPGWARGGFDTRNDGQGDIFVAKLTSGGGHAWSTYMGGSSWEWGYGIAVDGSGGVYVTGSTSSPGWAWGGFDTSHNGSDDIFVAKLTSAGARAWSTYIGGDLEDSAAAIAVHGSGAYLTGYRQDGRKDIFVAKLNLGGAGGDDHSDVRDVSATELVFHGAPEGLAAGVSGKIDHMGDIDVFRFETAWAETVHVSVGQGMSFRVYRDVSGLLEPLAGGSFMAEGGRYYLEVYDDGRATGSDYVGQVVRSNTSPDVEIGDGVATSVAYTDRDGTWAMASFYGGRTVLQFDGDNITQTRHGAMVRVEGDDLTLQQVDVIDSNARSSIVFRTRQSRTAGDDGLVTVGQLTAATPLAAFIGYGVDFVGDGIRMTGDGYARVVIVHDMANGADIVMPGEGAPAGVVILANRLSPQTDVTLGSPLRVLRAAEWRGGRLDAPRASTVIITGNASQGIRGDFGADVTLRRADRSGYALRVASIRGDIRGGVWDLGGNVAAIYASSTSAQWELNADGWIGSLFSRAAMGGSVQAKYIHVARTLGDLTADLTLTGWNAAGVSLGVLWAGEVVGDVTLSAAGVVNLIRAWEWQTGRIAAGGIRRLLVTGNRHPAVGLDGDFGADVTLDGIGVRPGRPFLGPVTIRGDLTSDIWDVTGTGGPLFHANGR